MRLSLRSGCCLSLVLALGVVACSTNSDEKGGGEQSGGDGDQSGDGDSGGDGDALGDGDGDLSGDGDGDGDGNPSGDGDSSPGDGDGGSVSFPEEKCELDLAAQFELVEFPVEVNAQQDQSTAMVVTPDDEGGLWLAWTDSPWSEEVLNAHVRHVSSDLEMDGPALDLPGSIVVGMFAHSDGTLAIAHGMRTGPEHPDDSWNGSPGGVAPNTLFLSKYDGDTEVFKTQIQGGEGYENNPESTWFLADWTGASVSVSYTGSRYALFYVIGRHFEDGGVHQADEYVELGADGALIEGTRQSWINSHSFWPSSVALGGDFYTLTSSDPFPTKTLVLGRYTDGAEASFTSVWPTPDIIEQVMLAGPSSRAGAIFEVGGKLATVIRTWVDKDAPATPKGDTRTAALISFETDGTPVGFAKLAAESVVENDLVAGGARFGTDVLALYGQGGNTSVFGGTPVVAQVFAVDGTPQSDPIELAARMAWSSDPVTLKDGSVVWPAVKDNVSKTVQLARIGCK